MSASRPPSGSNPAFGPRLAAGTRLGPYEIKAPLGAGGMGEVYRARDTRLDRDVAVKVLRGGRAVSAEARARFEREARAVSALNHPNISALYDIGRQETPDGPLDYLVMELIEGETLADRLTRGPLPIDDLLRVAVPIADALDRAHRKGIVHRDLKPGNIMLAKAGPKLLDFGLARPAGIAPGSSSGASDLSASPTMTRALTQEGAIVGTFQYMSPEQLEGKEADARSDLFAFGATLYEMATGRKAFDGTSQASLIAAIMNARPQPMRSLQPLAPAALERVVATCLARDPDDRWQSAGDLKRELQWVAGSSADADPGTGTATSIAALRRIHLFWAAAVVLSILVTAALGARLRPPSSPAVASLLRASIAPPTGARFNIIGDVAGPPVLSPDGRRMVFAAIDAGGNRLWVRSLDDLEARVLPGTDGAMYPFWSPDGRSVAFFTFDKVKRIDVDGGAVYTICDAGGSPRGGAWAPDGTILFPASFDKPLSRVPAGGGTPEPLTRLETGKHTTHRWPQFLPDGRHFIYLAAHHEKQDSEDNGIYLGSLDGGEPVRLFSSKSSAVYADGYLFYVQGNALVTQRFDAAAGRVAGPAVPTAERVQLDRTTWRGIFSIGASTRSLVYMPAAGKVGTRILSYDITTGAVETVSEEASQLNMNLTPDGRRLTVESQDGPRSDIWIYDLVDGSRSRLTFDPMDESFATWVGRGDRIVFGSNRPDGRYRIYEKPSAGGTETLLFEWDEDVYPADVSVDGRFLLFHKGAFSSRPATDLYLLPLDGSKKPVPFSVGPHEDTDGQFSQDGRWIAYTSTQSGQEEVYVAPRPDPAAPAGGEGSRGQWQISSGGGSLPRWARDGRTIFYRRADNSTFVMVEVDGRGAAFVVGSSRELPYRSYQNWASQSYDVSADGRRLVVASPGGDSASTMALVSDWSAIVK
jgi:Tol biopolymer transport system component